MEEPERPDDWVGKPWACYCGYKHAIGEILLFTDADTWHDPKSLNATVAELEESQGFLSFLTSQELKSFWEYMMLIIFLIISITERGTRGTANAHIANGQYMMFTRDCYEDLGTHEAVANSIIEDLAFGTLAADSGVPPRIVTHKGLVKTRMYHNLAEISEGFGKNLALGIKQAGISSIFGTGLVTLWALGPGFILIIRVSTNRLITPVDLFVIIIGYLTFVALLSIIEYQLSSNISPYVLCYPLYFIVFEIIVLRSMVQTYIRKEITWKDRAYNLE